MLNKRPLVLVIAGLDSGGGAGVTADCLTVHDNGAYALPCVTALTAQSLKEVSLVENSSKAMFTKCIELAMRDWQKIDAIKIGLVTSQEHLDIILHYLSNELLGVPVVWDPVLTATAGRLDSADLKSALPKLLAHTTIFTPNLPEALELANWTVDDLESKGIEQLAKYFLDLGCQNIIIKGGHATQAVSARDIFANSHMHYVMSYDKKSGDGAHGGGCALSSALAALIAQGYAPFDAAVLAKAYITQGIFESYVKSGDYRPPMAHHGFIADIKYLPHVEEPGFPHRCYDFPKTTMHMGLYPVVPTVYWVERLLKAGVRTIQLRIKDKNDPDLYIKILQAVELGNQYCARVFIDDHYELAIKAGAYGVHLGMEDVTTADLDKIRASGMCLGLSTHGPYEMIKALQIGPSYIALGHIFPTNSKVMPSSPQGVDKLAREAKLLENHMPTVAIGGIKLDKAQAVADTKVGSIALITALTDIEDDSELQQAVDQWLEIIGTGGDHF